MIVGSTLKFSLTKGFGEFFWNLCPVCGCASIRTTFWEDGTAEHGECLVCMRMSEVMELDEDFGREGPAGR
jgi:hypothetical protein